MARDLALAAEYAATADVAYIQLVVVQPAKDQTRRLASADLHGLLCLSCIVNQDEADTVQGNVKVSLAVKDQRAWFARVEGDQGLLVDYGLARII